MKRIVISPVSVENNMCIDPTIAFGCVILLLIGSIMASDQISDDSDLSDWFVVEESGNTEKKQHATKKVCDKDQYDQENSSFSWQSVTLLILIFLIILM